jgi:outer membrane biosynthesis protein TonB
MKEEDMNHLRQQDRNLRDALRQEEAALPQMSADLNERLMQRMESEQPKQHRTVWRWMAAAAFLLLLIGIGYTLLIQQQDEPLVAQQSVESQTEEPEPKAEPESVAEEPQQKIAKAEVQSSQKPVKKQRKVVMKLVELIPTSEAEPTNMKTLPASVIAKVKAYDKQSDLSRMTGIDDTDPLVAMTAQVIDTDPLVAMEAHEENIRQRGKRLEEEITAFMNN